MFDIGDKVIEKATGDIGTVTREDSECCWYVLWETGGDTGQELWVQGHLIELYTPTAVAYSKKIEELEAKVENLQKELEISNRFYEVVKKERDYYINLCREKPETSRYTGLAGY